MTRTLLSLLSLLPLLSLTAVTVQAEDRALLIGIGQFRNLPETEQLPGIEIDLDSMQTVAAQLGYLDRQIRILHDNQATRSAVMAAFEDWLVEGVGPSDQILLYLSTHGTQVLDQDVDHDESEGLDEAFLMHDSVAIGADGNPSLTNLLLDDDIRRALAAIPSQNVLVIIDACHSGTGTRNLRFRSMRSGSDRGRVKAYVYTDMPFGTASGFDRSQNKLVNYVSLSAAAADERSIATERGSLFTQALVQSISDHLRTSADLTPLQLHDRTSRWIAKTLHDEAPHRVFHPQIAGNPTLFDKPLRLMHTTSGHGPLWIAVKRHADAMFDLPMRINRSSFREGDNLVLTIDLPGDGYLNIVGIDPQDHGIVVFPNSFSRNNRVSAGEMRIPDNSGYNLPATPPYGPTLLAAFFTEHPVDLFASGNGQRDHKGNLLDHFPALSHAGMHGFPPTASSSRAAAAATVEVRICPATGCQ